jgi:hypothetical protein
MSIDILTIRPQYYERDFIPYIKGSIIAADRVSIIIPQAGIRVGSFILPITEQEISIDNAANWDDTQYATAANRAGEDFYIYAAAEGIKLSANSTVLTGYSTANCTQLGGFHCQCLDVGVIAAHPLTGFITGDILPLSIWDGLHRPVCAATGMAWCAEADLWMDIYLQSGTGVSTASIFGGTITDTRIWNDHVDDLAAVGKRMLNDPEFQAVAEGSNQKTNIVGSADPVTTGGHVDTAGRRMVSNYGLEDCCGVVSQWLSDQSYRNDDASYLGTWGWYTLPGNKGSIYKQGGTGDVKLVAGGYWSSGSYCGSRFRDARYSRWSTITPIGSRGCARQKGGR